MENEDTKNKEIDDSTPQRRRKAGLKFPPKVLPKKAPKAIPIVEPHEENKAVTVDKKMISPELELRLRNKESFSRLHLDKQTLQFQELSPLQEAFHQDYTSTNCPVILPLRRPNSGDPESLDEEEFGHPSSRTQDELIAAEELYLLETVDTPQLLFFRLPTSLPLPRQVDPVAETETGTNVNAEAESMGDNRKRRISLIHGCGLKELPGGHMGKIFVYKSGKVKMTLGDVLFDVAAGSNCMFAQDVVAIDTRGKHCCSLGELGKRAIVTPAIDCLLGSVEKM